MKRLLTATSVLAVGVLPLLFSRDTIDPVTVPRFLFLSILALIALLGIVFLSSRSSTRLDFSFMRRGMVIAYAGYLLVATLSISQAPNFGEALFYWLKAGVAFLFFVFVTALLVTYWESRLVITKAVITMGLCLATIGIMQHLSLGFLNIPGNITPYGTMANKNLLASAILLIMPFALFGVISLKRLWAMGAGVLVVLNSYLVLACRTRSVWLALTVASIVALAVAVLSACRRAPAIGSDRPPLRRILMIISVLTLVVVVVLTVAVTVDLSRGYKNSTLMNYFDDHNLRVRSDLWRKSIQMYMTDPVLGTGIGNWKIVIPRHGIAARAGAVENAFFQRPHNDFIWVLAETGPVGLLCYLAIFGLAVVYGFRLLVKREGENDRDLWLLMIFGLTGYLAVSSFSFPRERIAHTVLLMLMLAVILAGYHRAFPTGKLMTHKLHSGLISLALVVLLLSVWVGHGRFLGEVYTKRAVAAASISDWGRVIEEIDLGLYPLVTVDPTSTPLYCYRGIAHSNLGKIDSAFEDYQKALAANPHHVQVLNNLATCYEQGGDHEQAIRLYKKALQASPFLEQTLVNLAAVYYNIGEYRQARELLTGPRGGPADPRYEQFLNIVNEKIGNQGGTHVKDSESQ